MESRNQNRFFDLEFTDTTNDNRKFVSFLFTRQLNDYIRRPVSNRRFKSLEEKLSQKALGFRMIQ